MYNLSASAKASYDEKLRAAARDHPSHQAYAARRARNRSASAARLADLDVLDVLHGRRAAQAY